MSSVYSHLQNERKPMSTSASNRNRLDDSSSNTLVAADVVNDNDHEGVVIASTTMPNGTDGFAIELSKLSKETLVFADRCPKDLKVGDKFVARFVAKGAYANCVCLIHLKKKS